MVLLKLYVAYTIEPVCKAYCTLHLQASNFLISYIYIAMSAVEMARVSRNVLPFDEFDKYARGMPRAAYWSVVNCRVCEVALSELTVRVWVMAQGMPAAKRFELIEQGYDDGDVIFARYRHAKDLNEADVVFRYVGPDLVLNVMLSEASEPDKVKLSACYLSGLVAYTIDIDSVFNYTVSDLRGDILPAILSSNTATLQQKIHFVRDDEVLDHGNIRLWRALVPGERVAVRRRLTGKTPWKQLRITDFFKYRNA